MKKRVLLLKISMHRRSADCASIVRISAFNRIIVLKYRKKLIKIGRLLKHIKTWIKLKMKDYKIAKDRVNHLNSKTVFQNK